MILYHFPTSPYARRVRLALAFKGLAVELRNTRAEAEHLAAVQRLNPMHTVPVLVDGERVIGDSGAILHYLDRKVPAPPLWPEGLAGADAIELVIMCDAVITLLADLGMRYAAVHSHPNFPAVREALLGRAQRTLEQLATTASTRAERGPFLCGATWSAADMAVLTLVQWLEGLPIRAKSFPPAAKMVELGWSLPAELSRWASHHAGRPDVVALG